MAGSAKTSPGEKQMKNRRTKARKARQREKRVVMSDLREYATEHQMEHRHFRSVSPAEALQECLDRAYGEMCLYAEIAERLTKDEMWVDTINGQSPHPAIREYRNARAEVAFLAGRGLDIGLEDRKVAMGEKAADVIALLITGVMDELDLTDEQRDAVGPAIRRQIESGEIIDGTAVETNRAAA